MFNPEKRKRIPLSEPLLYGNEKEWVLRCLESNWVSSSGPFVEQFEDEIAQSVNAPHKKSVVTASGTAALHLALLTAGVKPGELVLVPTLTFIATVNAINYVGAEPLFFGSDSRLCMDLNSLEEFLQNECRKEGAHFVHKSSSRRISAVMPVHVLGFTVDVFRLRSLFTDSSVAILEDAAESMGSLVKSPITNDWVTSGTIGDLGCYSFNGNKIITSGGGGSIVGNNQEWLKRCKYLANQAKDDALFFEHHSVGYNYRMTSLEAALGIAQLKNLSTSIERRTRIHLQYRNHLKNADNVEVIEGLSTEQPNYWLTAVRIKNWNLDQLRSGIFKLQELGIEARPVWTLNHTQAPYRKCATFKPQSSEADYPKILCIPSSSNLTEEEVGFVADNVVRIAAH